MVEKFLQAAVDDIVEIDGDLSGDESVLVGDEALAIRHADPLRKPVHTTHAGQTGFVQLVEISEPTDPEEVHDVSVADLHPERPLVISQHSRSNGELVEVVVSGDDFRGIKVHARTEERRGGKECGSPGRSRGEPEY